MRTNRFQSAVSVRSRSWHCVNFESVSFGFSGAEERRSRPFPWCSRPAGQQAEEQIHQHPPLWVTDSKASWSETTALSFYKTHKDSRSFSSRDVKQVLVFAPCSGPVLITFAHGVKTKVSMWSRVDISSLQTTSAASSWCRCTMMKDQTTSTPTTYPWATAAVWHVFSIFTSSAGFCNQVFLHCFISRATNTLKSTSPLRARCLRLAMISGRWCCSRNLPSSSCSLSATNDGGWVWFPHTCLTSLSTVRNTSLDGFKEKWTSTRHALFFLIILYN